MTTTLTPARGTSLLSFFLLSLLAACASAPAWPATGPGPTPYTAEQIRAAHPDGTMLHFLVVAPGVPETVHVTRFTAGDAEGVTVESWTEDRDENPTSEQRSSRSTWVELQNHAVFDAARTSREEARCHVGGADYDCWLYTVTDPGGSRTRERFWFAHEHPGPPVLLVREVDGVEVRRMELLEYCRGVGKR
ncbi:MAG: hypothetical protein KDE27_32985 [Planctomycetes bacterium]|nr:hypothetical protein [Planctomycetota bacterium]